MINIGLFLLISFFLSMDNTCSAFVSGSTGADGAFSPTASTELQVPSNGVFNFTTVNIPYGVTVTFKKNAANTPVYILATGNITIQGTINVNGKNAVNDAGGGKSGPGGFDGGTGGYIASPSPGGKGLGPGGGGGGSSTCAYGGGGSFGSAGATLSGTNCGAAGSIYGNSELQSLTGGSGGGGAYNNYGGGGGGGAILIASSGTINLATGSSITANGGNAYSNGAGGSGGAIRLIANTLTGNGTLEAKGGSGGAYNNIGGYGRIRLEASIVDRTAGPVFVYYPPVSVFLTNTPTLRITSIGGVNAPESPLGSLSTPDIFLPATTTNPVTVTLNASYIPVGTTVTVSVVPKFGNASNVTTTLNGVLETSTASAAVTLPSGNYASVIQAYVVFTLQTAFYWEGEKINRVRVAANLGGESETVYITESGREIKSAELMTKLNSW
jgi:hypothetical protein